MLKNNATILELCISSVDPMLCQNRKIHPSYYLFTYPQIIICFPYYIKYEACCMASKSSTFRASMLLISYREWLMSF